MKISNETLNILKNFSKINNSIIIKPGDVIRTESNDGDVYAIAKVKENFTNEMCISDLSDFLSVISIFKTELQFDFDDVNLLIKDDKNTLKYRLRDREVVHNPRETTPTLGDVVIPIRLMENEIDWIMKIVSILKSSQIAFISHGDGTNVEVLLFNKDNDSVNTNVIKLSQSVPQKFKLLFNSEKLKMISGDYLIEFTSKVNKNGDLVIYCRMYNERYNVEYYMSCEYESEHWDD